MLHEPVPALVTFFVVCVLAGQKGAELGAFGDLMGRDIRSEDVSV